MITNVPKLRKGTRSDRRELRINETPMIPPSIILFGIKNSSMEVAASDAPITIQIKR